jgi:hypothetical protein
MGQSTFRIRVHSSFVDAAQELLGERINSANK